MLQQILTQLETGADTAHFCSTRLATLARNRTTDMRACNHDRGGNTVCVCTTEGNVYECMGVKRREREREKSTFVQESSYI